MEKENSHFQDHIITIIGRKWNCDKRWPHFRPPQMRSEETAPFSGVWVDEYGTILFLEIIIFFSLRSG